MTSMTTEDNDELNKKNGSTTYNKNFPLHVYITQNAILEARAQSEVISWRWFCCFDPVTVLFCVLWRSWHIHAAVM